MNHQGGFSPSAVQDGYTRSFIQGSPSMLGTGVPALMRLDLPSGVRPAMFGLIFHESVRAPATAGTIVDLALRGYLGVERFTPQNGWAPQPALRSAGGQPEPGTVRTPGPSEAGVVRAVGDKLGHGVWLGAHHDGAPADAEPVTGL